MKTRIKNLFLPCVLTAGLGLILVRPATAQTFTNLHSFSATYLAFSSGEFTNSDGANPYNGLTLSGDALYGTASIGGRWGQGTVFKVSTDGTSFTNLHSFNWSSPQQEGSNPSGDLVLSDNTLYGTTTICTLFQVNTDTTGFTTLYCGPGSYGGLVLSSNTLFGTTDSGCVAKNGMVFGFNTEDRTWPFQYCFSPTWVSGVYTNSDGATPYARLLLSGNTLYGTTSLGGLFRGGTVFAISIDGTGFTNLHNFSGGDGAGSHAGLILFGDTLYGTTQYGGS